MRGSQGSGARAAYPRGSIPTCAGQPQQPESMLSAQRVYPHVCGAAWRVVALQIFQSGLSPRVRGSRDCTDAVRRAVGSIPTCAGQPSRQRGDDRVMEVYPHVCGAAITYAIRSNATTGLSPRVRGSPIGDGGHPIPSGSIPTCAGQPDLGPAAQLCPEVYPHVCGAAR